MESGLVGYYLVGDGCADQVAVAMLKKIGDEDRARNIIRRWTGVVYVMKPIFSWRHQQNKKNNLRIDPRSKVKGTKFKNKMRRSKSRVVVVVVVVPVQ